MAISAHIPVVTAALVAALLTVAPPATAAPPNVVLIISDDQHWSDYGFMGHEHLRTPALDRLARESLVFARGYSPFSRDKTYGALGRYCDRIERLASRRGTAMLTLDEQLPGDRELPGRRDGHQLLVSKRLFIRSVLGYLPLFDAHQP